MFQITGIPWALHKTLFWIGQIPVDRRVNTPERAAEIFSGPQFLVALIAGVVLAIALQLVLTNLSVAAGISYLGHQSDSDAHDASDNIGGTIRKIGTAVGIWTLVTVTIALFIASLLAVKLSLISSSTLGAIVGLVIWAAYFSLLVWAGSSTVGSLVGSVVNTATSGFQAIVGTATAAIGAKAVNDQVVATAEAAAAAVRREFGSAIDPEGVKETLQDYLQQLRPAELDFKGIRSEFERLLSDPELKAIAPENLRNIDRQKFVDLVSSRTDLSKRDLNRIVDQLESVWKQVVDAQAPQRDRIGELIDYFKSAQPQQLRGELNPKLDQLIAEVRGLRQPPGQQEQGQGGGVVQQTVLAGLNALLGTVMNRTDLSDLDIEKVLGQLRVARDTLTQQAGQLATTVKSNVPALPYNTIRADVENYLLNAHPWQLNRANLEKEFRDVIYDPQADPSLVRRQLEQLRKSDFVQLLTSKGIFTQAKVNEIADQLEAVRRSVLTTVQQTEEQERTQEVYARVSKYLQLTSQDQLRAEGIDRDFRALLEDPDADVEQLRTRFAQLDRNTLLQMLSTRQDIDRSRAESIVNELERIRDRVLFEAQKQEEETKAQTEALWVKLESYLRNTGKDELNPEGIKRDLQTFLDDPKAGTVLLRSRLSRFDRDTLVQLLATRQDLSEEQANRIVHEVEDTWNNVVHAPQIAVSKAKEYGEAVTDKAKDQYDNTTTAIADYLRNTGKEELNPEGIKRDLTKLLENPKDGAAALRDRLSQVDRDTLVKLLSQRGDLSEEQVNQTIDQVQDTFKSMIKAPRRLAARTQAQVKDFQATLEDYLRHTGKDELNPEAIKRDLQLLLNDPRTGVESIGDRLSRFDRSTIVALLSQREDISEAEANRIVNQVLSVRDQFVEQVRSIQRRIQDVVDGVFARVRNYLNSLERPELNYDGIRQDVRKLFDDPQAGFDALRDRLGHFNRDTLVALLSSREDISEADANRIIDQIEGARNSVLQRVDRLQQEAQRRLDTVKAQAQRQAEETRKAAATAAWWLFGTAIASAIGSAIGGALAVVGGH